MPPGRHTLHNLLLRHAKYIQPSEIGYLCCSYTTPLPHYHSNSRKIEKIHLHKIFNSESRNQQVSFCSDLISFQWLNHTLHLKHSHICYPLGVSVSTFVRSVPKIVTGNGFHTVMIIKKAKFLNLYQHSTNVSSSPNSLLQCCVGIYCMHFGRPKRENFIFLKRGWGEGGVTKDEECLRTCLTL